MKVAAPEFKALITQRAMISSCAPVGDGRKERLSNELDHHFAIDGSSDFDTPIFETVHRSGTLPSRIVTNVLSLFEEIRESAGIELGLEKLTTMKERFASRIERSMKDDEELESFL